MNIELTKKQAAFLAIIAIGDNVQYTYGKPDGSVPPNISCYTTMIGKRLVADLDHYTTITELQDSGMLMCRYEDNTLSITPFGAYALLVHSLKNVA